jgi:hypothetical protein
VWLYAGWKVGSYPEGVTNHEEGREIEVTDKYSNMLDEIENQSSTLNLSTWEDDFIDSLRQQIDSGRSLTERQKDKLRDIYEDKVLEW